MEKRAQWVDLAKGFGIILVVYGHVIRGVAGSSILNQKAYNFIDSLVYSFHMPLFFLLSGLFFAKSLDKYQDKGLIIEKIKTLLYPYIIWSLLQTSIEILLSKFTNGNIGLDTLYTCLIIPRAQFWFLFALFFINVFNVLLHYLIKNYWLLVSTLVGVIYYLFPFELYIFSNTFKFLIFFNIGVLASNVIFDNTKMKHYINTKYTVLVIFFFVLLEYLYIHQENRNTIVSLLTALSGVLLVVYISKIIINSKIAGTLILLGTFSFEIYILHILITAGIRILLLKMSIDNVYIHVIVGTILGIFIPYKVTKLISSYKGYNLLFRFPIANTIYK